MDNNAAVTFRRHDGEKSEPIDSTSKNSRRRSSRTKVHNYRVRKKHGLCVLKITAYEYGLLEYLIESGRLTVAEALDRRRVEHAVSEVLAELAARWA